VEYLLRNGLQSPHKLLSEYIKAHTLCDLDNTGLPYALDEPKLQFEVPDYNFEWDRLKAGKLVLQPQFPPLM
jgi:hypothetical protein